MKTVIFALLFVGFNSVYSQTDSTNILWKEYGVNNIASIQIPPSLELRNAKMDVIVDSLKGSIANRLDVVMPAGEELVFQPTGSNSGQKSPYYSRIIVRVLNGTDGTFHLKNDPFIKSQADSTGADSEAKNQILQQMDVVGVKLIEWDGFDLIKINDCYASKICYTRQLANNPPVHVTCIQFENNNVKIELTLSFRLTEKHLWENDFELVYSTFRWLM